MKKVSRILFFIAMLMPSVAWAQQASSDKIVISDLQTDDFGTFFTVGLEGSLTYSALNMDIIFPEGVEVAYYEGEPDVAINETDNTVFPFSKDKKGNITWKHTVATSYGVIAPRQLRIACYSDELAVFTATSGDLFIIYVEVDNSVFAKSFSPKPIVKVSGIALIEQDATKHVPADFVCRPFSTGIAAERELPVNISASNQVGTLILPFAAPLPDGVKAYTCNGVDEEEEGMLTLTPASSFEACKPYIVYAPQGYSGTVSGTVDMTAEYPLNDIYTDGLLTGVLTPKVVSDGYIMQNQGEGPMFYDAEGANFSLNAGRCYLTPAQSASVKAYSFDFDQANAIEGVTDNKPAYVNGVIYDLTGRPVSAPAQGIYILNGKKILVK